MLYARKNYKHQWQSAGLTSEHAHHVCVVYQFLAPVVLTNWENATIKESTEQHLGSNFDFPLPSLSQDNACRRLETLHFRHSVLTSSETNFARSYYLLKKTNKRSIFYVLWRFICINNSHIIPIHFLIPHVIRFIAVSTLHPHLGLQFSSLFHAYEQKYVRYWNLPCGLHVPPISSYPIFITVTVSGEIYKFGKITWHRDTISRWHSYEQDWLQRRMPV